MENKLNDRFAGWYGREKYGDIGRWTVNISAPRLRCKPYLLEMQAGVIAGLVASVVIPFYVDLSNTKGVAGLVIYSHLHNIVVQPERPMRYTCNAVAANGCRRDGRNECWQGCFGGSKG